jgi:phosphatidylglycerophosphatase GEP4
LASDVERNTGVTVLSHRVKKPGCGDEIMSYFKAHPETGVTSPHQIAVVGDRLTTDMMLANMMGSWGFWVRDGVVPLPEKSMVSAQVKPPVRDELTHMKFSRMERSLSTHLQARGYSPALPTSPFE